MNNLQIFENPDFGQVRMVMIEDNPYFVGKDVAEILGYKNPNEAIQDHVDNEDKFLRSSMGSEMLKLFSSVKDIQNKFGRQDNWFINESGVYALVFSSKLPKAKEFKRWVTSEVLPAIRKHGAYMTEQTVEKALTSPDFLIQLATNLKKEQEARMKAEATLAEQKPKVLFADTVSGSKTSILVGQLARLVKQKGFDIGQNRLFKWLRDKGYLMKNKNEPTQRSMDLKVMEVKERTVNNPDGSTRITRTPMITGKGQIYFVDRLLGGKRKAEKAD